MPVGAKKARGIPAVGLVLGWITPDDAGGEYQAASLCS